jgi:hypothetical protein
VKPLRQLLATAALSCVLASSVIAGDIQCGDVPPPPEPPPSMTSRMPEERTLTSGTSSDTSYIDPISELTLSLLQSVLSLF